jgi:hypothetical protein
LSTSIREHFREFLDQIQKKTTYQEDIIAKRIDMQVKYLTRKELP